MSLLVVMAVAALSFSTAVEAGSVQTDKSEIISVVAEKLSSTFSGNFADAVVKPKIHIAEINSKATVLDSNDIAIIAEKFESSIIKSVIVLDREKTAFTSSEESFQLSGATADAIAIGTKLGATHLVFLSFRDQVSKIDTDLDKVTLVAKLTIVEIATARKVMAESMEFKFTHRSFGETYYVRNTASGALGVAALASLGASAAFGYAASTSKKDYDKAQNAGDAKTYREKTELNQKLAYGSLGISILSFGLKLWVDSGDKNFATYHEYQLTFLPVDGGNVLSGGYSWHF